LVGLILGLFEQNLPKADMIQFDFQPAATSLRTLIVGSTVCGFLPIKAATLLPERDDPWEISCGGRP